MLQRIQTIFLVLSCIAMQLAVFLPLAYLTYNNAPVKFEAMGFYQNGEIIYSSWGLFFIGAISSILSLITIFSYKKRMLQMRLSIFNIIIMVGFYLFFAFLIFMRNPEANSSLDKIGVGLIMPIISIIFTWLAIRRIGADEALVRSVNRLRK